jgi:integrase
MKKRAERDILSAEEAMQLILAVKDDQLYIPVLLGLNMGLRLGEVSA